MVKKRITLDLNEIEYLCANADYLLGKKDYLVKEKFELENVLRKKRLLSKDFQPRYNRCNNYDKKKLLGRYVAISRVLEEHKNEESEKRNIPNRPTQASISYMIKDIGFKKPIDCKEISPMLLIERIESNVDSLLSKEFSSGKKEETIRKDLNEFFQNIESSNIPLMAQVRVEQLKDECEKRLKSYSQIEEVDNLDGHQFERFCAVLLERNGFTNVEVTKGSGDHGVDVLAQKEEIHYAIQCKCYDSDLGNKPIQEVYAGKEFYNCQVGVVMTNQHFTKGAKEMANATRVLLWDREKLLELMKN